MKTLLTILLIAFSTAYGQTVDTVNYPIFGDGVTTEFKFALQQPYDLLGCTFTSQPITASATVPAFYVGHISNDTLSVWIRNVYDLDASPAPLRHFPRRPPYINLQCYLRQQ